MMWFLESLMKHGLPVYAATDPGMPVHGGQAEKGIYALFLILLIPMAIGLLFILRSIYRNTIGKKMKTTLLEDFRKEAEGLEKSRKYVSAAGVYETKLADINRAAALYEKGNDYRKAASLYEQLGQRAKAKEMYEKDGNFEASAGISIIEGEYEEAARLYDLGGNKQDAALLMERAGRGLAAVKAYREAGDYRNAARMLEAEGLPKEAAEMFGISLCDKRPDSSNMGDFYTYASKLEKAGVAEKAVEVYREIDKADPTYKDVRERLQRLSPPGKVEEDLKGKITVRGFIRNGSMDPRSSIKLWLQILRGLQDAYSNGRPYGLLAPDNIAVDSNNRITFLDRRPSEAYVAPETAKGIEPDARSDVYSMGVILYEMLTGSLDGLGSTRVSDLVGDLPEWLDELVIRCIRKVREDRYQGIEEIFADIKTLSKSKKDSQQGMYQTQ